MQKIHPRCGANHAAGKSWIGLIRLSLAQRSSFSCVPKCVHNEMELGPRSHPIDSLFSHVHTSEGPSIPRCLAARSFARSSSPLSKRGYAFSRPRDTHDLRYHPASKHTSIIGVSWLKLDHFALIPPQASWTDRYGPNDVATPPPANPRSKAERERRPSI